MNKNRFSTRLSSGALVIAVATGGALLTSGVSTAAPVATSPVATTTTLTSPTSSSAVQGTLVTLSATVSPAADGYVQFKDGAADLDSPVHVTNGIASKTVSLPAKQYSLTAMFTSANQAAYTSSTSSPAKTFVVTAPQATATTLLVLPGGQNPQVVPTLLKATVVPETATGTVQFFQDGTTPLGSPVPVTSGSACSVASTLPQGQHTLTAMFTPSTTSASYLSSTSQPTSVMVTGSPGGALVEQLSTGLQNVLQSVLGGR